LRGDFKRYLYGPGRSFSRLQLLIPSIHTAHAPDEFVEKADLLEAVEGYKKLILHGLK
jgi:acetylornithine deacetylase/succinyl-diaminopimelate desuccinylase-like protein